MPEKTRRQNIFEDLRRRAEQILEQQGKMDAHMNSEELLHLLHEIEVYQVEVELQNEELQHKYKELEASRDEYFDLFNFAPVGFMVLDDKGLIKQANSTAVEILEVETAWLIGSNLWLYIDDRDRYKFFSWFRRMTNQSDMTDSPLDLRFLGNTKRILHIRLDGKTVCDKASHPKEWRIALTDITERKQADRALREKTRLLQNIIDTTSDLISITDMEGNLTFVSPSHSILGYDPDSLVGRNIMELIHPDDYQEIATAFADFLANREDWRKVEYRCRRADEDHLWLETVAKFILDDAGNPKEIIFSSRDFTERVQADEKIRYLQKSESLGRMAGAVAHHFNNQLSVVMGNLELVLDDLPDDAEHRENLFQSFEAGHKAAEVSQQMLRYLGHISGSQTAINLSDVCRQSLAFFQSASPSGVTYNVDFPDSGPIVHADAGQIQQILTNLLTNAQESLPDNQGVIGLIIQRVSHEDISTSSCFPLDWHPQEKPYACLEISDTGCGISMKDIVKLFDPFYTTKFTGRGMGLSVIMGILKAHGGCIIVDSKPGCGSVFRVYLPIASAKKTVTPEKLTTPKRNVGNGGTVLLIEDEAGVRNTAKIMINRLGYTVIEAQDGVEAVKLFQERQNEIDCVLSDLTMPRMNGWETLAELRKMGSDVPVILASGYDKKSVMSGDHPELPQGFLNKPYSMAALKEVLLEVRRLL